MMLGPTSPRQCSSRAASKYPTGPVLTGKGTCELHALRCGVSCGLAVSPRAGPASSELGGGWMGCRGCCLRAKETPPPSPSSSMPRSRLAPSLPMAQDLCTRVHTGLVTGRGHPPPPQQPFAEAPGKGQAAELLHGGRSLQAPADATGRPSAPQGTNHIVPMLLQPPTAAQVSPPLPLPNHSSIPRGLGDARAR